jgi:PAS domain S-box-containing protein
LPTEKTSPAKPSKSPDYVSIGPIRPPNQPVVWREYGIALLTVAVAFAVRFLLDPVLQNQHVFVTFFIGAATIAWYCGLGPTLVAILAGGVLADYFFAPPRMSFSLEKTGWISMTIYFAGTLYLGLMAHRRKHAEAERNRMRGYQILADSIPQLAWSATPDGYVDWHNQRWYAYTGTTEVQVEGWGWQSVLNPLELPKVLDRWHRALQTPQPFEMEYDLRGKDGVLRPHLVRVVPAKDDGGNIFRWFATATELTVRNEVDAEQKLDSPHRLENGDSDRQSS